MCIMVISLWNSSHMRNNDRLHIIENIISKMEIRDFYSFIII